MIINHRIIQIVRKTNWFNLKTVPISLFSLLQMLYRDKSTIFFIYNFLNTFINITIFLFKFTKKIVLDWTYLLTRALLVHKLEGTSRMLLLVDVFQPYQRAVPRIVTATDVLKKQLKIQVIQKFERRLKRFSQIRQIFFVKHR